MVYFNGFFEFNNFQNLFWIHVESHVEYQLHKLEKFNGFFEFNNFQNLFWIHVESHVEYQLHKLEKFKFQKLAWGDDETRLRCL